LGVKVSDQIPDGEYSVRSAIEKALLADVDALGEYGAGCVWNEEGIFNV
jgi:hypothetical protein